MKCKICGTGNFDDLKCAVTAGADAVGFLVGIIHKTEDAVTANFAKEMIHTLPPFIDSVIVTHLNDANELIRIVKETGCTTIQIHNEEECDTDKIRGAAPYLKIIKAVHVTDWTAIDKAKEVDGLVDGIILDSRTKERVGGTGITHDWNISAEIVKIVKTPVILAGGLNPNNLEEAITKVRHYAVDVHTGVKKDGRRNLELTKTFIDIAHRKIII